MVETGDSDDDDADADDDDDALDSGDAPDIEGDEICRDENYAGSSGDGV